MASLRIPCFSKIAGEEIPPAGLYTFQLTPASSSTSGTVSQLAL